MLNVLKRMFMKELTISPEMIIDHIGITPVIKSSKLMKALGGTVHDTLPTGMVNGGKIYVSDNIFTYGNGIGKFIIGHEFGHISHRHNSCDRCVKEEMEADAWSIRCYTGDRYAAIEALMFGREHFSKTNNPNAVYELEIRIYELAKGKGN